MIKKVPRLSILDNMVEEALKSDGFQFSSLEAGTIIDIEAIDIKFSFKILDPFEKEVWISGDYKHFKNPKKADFAGSKFFPSATMIRTDWIGFGMSLEFWLTTDEGERVWIGTSSIKKVSINGFTIYPKEDLSIN